MFDLSSVALGRRLKEMGLRSPDGMPVAAAIAEGLAMTQQLRGGGVGCWWNKRELPKRLQQAGLALSSDKPGKAFELAQALRKTMRGASRMAGDGDPCEKFVWDELEMTVDEAIRGLPHAGKVLLVYSTIKELERGGMSHEDARGLFPRQLADDADRGVQQRAPAPSSKPGPVRR